MPTSSQLQQQQQLEVTIPSASTVTPPDGKPYTAYVIACRLPLRTYTVVKRYSDFVDLNAAITAQVTAGGGGNSAPPYQIPPKHWFSSTLHNPGLTEERRVGLEAYLRGILTDPDPRWRNTPAWRSFLTLPAAGSLNAAGNSNSSARAALHGSLTGPGGQSGDAVSDPTVWLDTHRELIAALQTARERLASRNSALGARAQQEEAAGAKKQLIRAGTLLGALERALKRSPDDDDFAAGPRLGDGELRRRRDLLAAARREKERLEELQANIGRKEGADQEISVLEKGEPGQLSGLSNEASRSMQSTNNNNSTKRSTFGKGRVIGKETAKTRELDNTGLVQLQQQLMKDQDQDVDALAAAVRRQKALAIDINQELEMQSEMLPMLNDDASRVHDKVGVAKKRVNRIS